MMDKLKQLFSSNNNNNGAGPPSAASPKKAPPPKPSAAAKAKAAPSTAAAKGKAAAKPAPKAASTSTTAAAVDVRPLDPLYAQLSRDDETRLKAELILLSRVACGFALNVPSHPPTRDVLFRGLLDPSTQTPVSGCCLLPTGTRLKGVWQNGRFAEGTIEVITPALHYLYRGRFDWKLENVGAVDVMDGVNVTLKEGLFLNVRACVAATGGAVFIGSFEPPRSLAGYPKLTFGRRVTLTALSYQLVPNAVLNHASATSTSTSSSSNTTTPSTTAAAATNLPTRHPNNIFEFHFLGDLCTKFQTATTDSLDRLIDEGKLANLSEGSYKNFFVSDGTQNSNGACSVGSCEVDGSRCFLVEGISWSPQYAFRGRYVRGSIYHVGSGLFAAQQMKWAGLFVIGDDERSALLRGVRLRQLTVSSIESHSHSSSNDNHNNNNNNNKGAASPSPLSVAASQHTEVGTYSVVGKRSLRAGTRWTANAFADGHFSQDTSALVCGVYTTHANPSVHVRIPQTFALRNETDQSRVPCALPARAAMNSSGLRQWRYIVPNPTTPALKQVHVFHEDDALLLEHAFYHGDLFAVVSKGTVVFQVDPQESGWRQGSPRLGSLIQDREEVYRVVAEPRLTEELYFETLRSAASGTDILIHLDPHAHNPEVVTTATGATMTTGASEVACDDDEAVAVISSTNFLLGREPSLFANSGNKKLRNKINADHVPSHFVLNLPRYRWQLLHFDGVREQFAYPVADAWDPGMSTLDGPLGTGGLTEEDELALDRALMRDTITPLKLSVGYVTLNRPVRFVTKEPLDIQPPKQVAAVGGPAAAVTVREDGTDEGSEQLVMQEKDTEAEGEEKEEKEPTTTAANEYNEGVLLHRLAGEFHTSSSRAKMMQTPSFRKRQLIPPQRSTATAGGAGDASAAVVASDAPLWTNPTNRSRQPSPSNRQEAQNSGCLPSAADGEDRLTLLNHYSMTLQDSYSSLAFVKDYISRWMGSAAAANRNDEAEVSSTILLEPVPEQLDDGRGSWQITVDFIFWLSYRFACVPLIMPARSRGDMHGIWVSQLQHATSHAEAAEMGYALWLSHWRGIEEELRKRRLQFRPMQSLLDALRQRQSGSGSNPTTGDEEGGAAGVLYEPFPYGLLVRFVGLGSAPQLALAAAERWARARDSPSRQPPVPAQWLTTHLLQRKKRLSLTDTLDSVVSELPLFAVLPKTSEEFMEVQNALTSGAFPNSWTVLRIERVQNVALYRRFAAKRKAIAAENDGRSNEVRWMAHGTRTVDPRLVAKSGFDLRYSEVGLFGRASYFAFDAVYSHGYRHPLAKEDAAALFAECNKDAATTSAATTQLQGKEVSQLFLANVVCGKIEERLAADNSIRHPKDGYHSIAGPLTETHRGIMAYDLNQAYPAYLISYMH